MGVVTLNSQGSRPNLQCGQGVKHENLMGEDLDPGHGWEYRPLCSVTTLNVSLCLLKNCSIGDPGTFWLIALAGKLWYGRPGYILAHISEPTWASNFKFAGSVVVQRSLLVMVALTQNWLSAHYAWFSHGGSHMA